MDGNELVKALRDCINKCDCATCEYRNVSDKFGEKFCFDVLMDRAADLIEKQAIEIQELRNSLAVFGQANAALRDKVPEWIPVKERLPEIGVRVLTLDKWGHIRDRVYMSVTLGVLREKLCEMEDKS